MSRIDKDSKAARDRRIFDLWLACRTLDEIAGAVDVHKDAVSEICRKMAELPESDKAAASHATDFTPPLYNVWKQQEKTPGAVDLSEEGVRKVISQQTADLPEVGKSTASHASDFGVALRAQRANGAVRAEQEPGQYVLWELSR